MFLYWILMVLPAIAFFIGDFGENATGLRIFGICLIGIVVIDVIFKKRISSYVCKIIYFPLTLIIWWSRRKKRKKNHQPYTLMEMFIYDELFGSK